MVELVVTWLINAVGLYLAFGVAACIVLHARGLRAVDHGTAGASVLFRALITPGLIALWPIMLAKWRKSTRGEDSTKNANAPVRAATLRRIHGIAMRTLAVLLPIAVGVALVAREPSSISAGAGPLEDAALLPHVVSEIPRAFGDLPITVRVRQGESRARQIELEVARELDKPSLGLYWTEVSSDRFAADAGIYLGNVWGPGSRRFELSEDAIAKGGQLIIYSFVEASVFARAPVNVLSQS